MVSDEILVGLALSSILLIYLWSVLDFPVPKIPWRGCNAHHFKEQRKMGKFTIEMTRSGWTINQETLWVCAHENCNETKKTEELVGCVGNLEGIPKAMMDD